MPWWLKWHAWVCTCTLYNREKSSGFNNVVDCDIFMGKVSAHVIYSLPIRLNNEVKWVYMIIAAHVLNHKTLERETLCTTGMGQQGIGNNYTSIDAVVLCTRLPLLCLHSCLLIVKKNMFCAFPAGRKKTGIFWPAFESGKLRKRGTVCATINNIKYPFCQEINYCSNLHP